MPITSELHETTVEGWAEAHLRRYRATGDRRLRNDVVEGHRWLAVAIARDCYHGGEPFDDLLQVALLGLVKAAERFDPDYGAEYRSYAAVTARGEVRRHFRDRGWSINVPRRLQELRYEIRAATDVLTARLDRSPTTAEVAGYLHVDPDEVLHSMSAGRNYRSLSLDGESRTIAAAGATLEPGYDVVDAGYDFAALVDALPERLRRVVEMRFVDEMRQTDIAAVLGVSQVQVSRLLRTALARLRLIADRSRPPAPAQAEDPKSSTHTALPPGNAETPHRSAIWATIRNP